MVTAFLRRCGQAGAVWADRLAYAVVGRWAAECDPAVVRSLGRYVPLTTPWAPRAGEAAPADAGDLLLAWTRSGALTYGEAELLLAIDASTPWRTRP